MDPLSISYAVIMGVVVPLAKKLVERTVDPENIAEAVNWVFLATKHFLKIRDEQEEPDSQIPPPPTSSNIPHPTELTKQEIEKKAKAAKTVAESDSIDRPKENGIKQLAMDDFTLQQLKKEVVSLLNQLETYLGTLRFEEEKAAQYGGLTFAPPIVMNTIRIQQKEIAQRVQRLNQAMTKAYGVGADDLDILTSIT